MKQPGGGLWKLGPAGFHTHGRMSWAHKFSVFFCWGYPLLGKEPTGEKEKQIQVYTFTHTHTHVYILYMLFVSEYGMKRNVSIGFCW